MRKSHSRARLALEIEELFEHITRYTPRSIELDAQIKPFIPDMIPSIGEVDAFLKMSKPVASVAAEASESLGLSRLDEPRLNPSNASVLEFQLYSSAVPSGEFGRSTEHSIKSIHNADKKPNEIEQWIIQVSELKRYKPSPHVLYSKRFPDLDSLMQPWPAEIEELLLLQALPSLSDLQGLDLVSFARLVSAFLDVPVHEHRVIESLHLMFTLLVEFQENPHFSYPRNCSQSSTYNLRSDDKHDLLPHCLSKRTNEESDIL
jgi:intraflagellar transport protein 46